MKKKKDTFAPMSSGTLSHYLTSAEPVHTVGIILDYMESQAMI